MSINVSRVTGVLGAAVAIAVLAAPLSAAAPITTGPGATRVGIDAAGRVLPASPTGRAVSAPGDGVPDIQWPPPGVVPPKYPASTLRGFAAAMGDHLATAFPAAVPQAQDMQLIPWGGERTGVIVDGQDYLTTFAVYHDSIGRTAAAYEIDAPGHFTTTPRQMCTIEEVLSCTATSQPDGSLVLHRLSAVKRTQGADLHAEEAVHYRLDGSVVWLTAYDYDPIFDGSPDAGPVRDRIALTTDQLTSLATDPAIHL